MRGTHLHYTVKLAMNLEPEPGSEFAADHAFFHDSNFLSSSTNYNFFLYILFLVSTYYNPGLPPSRRRIHLALMTASSPFCPKRLVRVN